jgi:hypothetical protein
MWSSLGDEPGVQDAVTGPFQLEELSQRQLLRLGHLQARLRRRDLPRTVDRVGDRHDDRDGEAVTPVQQDGDDDAGDDRDDGAAAPRTHPGVTEDVIEAAEAVTDALLAGRHVAGLLRRHVRLAAVSGHRSRAAARHPAVGGFRAGRVVVEGEPHVLGVVGGRPVPERDVSFGWLVRRVRYRPAWPWLGAGIRHRVGILRLGRCLCQIRRVCRRRNRRIRWTRRSRWGHMLHGWYSVPAPAASRIAQARRMPGTRAVTWAGAMARPCRRGRRPAVLGDRYQRRWLFFRSRLSPRHPALTHHLSVTVCGQCA